MSDRVALLDDPQLRAFLPMLYVAWADGDLTSEHREKIVERLAEQPWLRPAARGALIGWLDPKTPPSARELAALKQTLSRATGNLAEETRASLASLATALSDADPSSATAAREIAELLGIAELPPAAQGLDQPADDTLPNVMIDVAALMKLRDGERADIRQRVRAFLDDPDKRAYGLPRDTYREMVRGWLKELADQKIGALAYPGITSEEADLRAFMVAFEELAHGDLSLLVKFGVQFGLFGGSIFALGTQRHHALLRDIASMKMPGCFAMSEVGHGSNVSDLRTTARYVHETRTLELVTPSEEARKEWIGGAAHDARFATVFAQLEVDGQNHGIHAVLVPIRDEQGKVLPGVRTGDSGLKMGLNGVDNGRLYFDRVHVPRENLLDRFAHIDEEGRYQSQIASPGKRFFTMLGTLVGGRICVGSAGVSIAETALTIAIRYSTKRHQFGPGKGREMPLLEYPTHQRRLLPALATTYVLRFAFSELRRRFAEVMKEKEPDTRQLEAEVAGLKAIATWHATATVQACREACGGQGYLAVNRLPDLKADSDVFTTFEGDNTVLLQLVAKSLLTRFQKRLEDGGIGAVLRMIGSVASVAAFEKNPIATRNTDRDHIRGAEFQLAALRHRESTLVRTAANRLRKRLAQKRDTDDALLDLQEHLVEAARAYVDACAYEWFQAAIATLPDDHTRGWLAKLGMLHALSVIDAKMAWYLEDGYVEPPKARAIRKELEALQREIAPAAVPLVEAFGIPDACLAAPIAFFDPANPPT